MEAGRHTVTRAHEWETVIKKSRFIGRVMPVTSRADVEEQLSAWRHDQATHNAWAFRIGSDQGFSDDGEVRGTAGKPILGAIERSGLDAVLVLVTRYYGGVKLGTGGLARAYGGTAATCLSEAQRVPIIREVVAEIHFMFDDIGLVYGILDPLAKVVRTDEQYLNTGVKMTLRMEADQVAPLAEALREKSGGRLSLEVLSSRARPGAIGG